MRGCGLLTLLGLVLLAAPAIHGQCTVDWSNPSPAGGADDMVYAMAVFDADGSGPSPPMLYVAGTFSHIGGIAANRIARWNGTTWSALGEGISNTVFDMTVYDPDGSGSQPAALYVGGSFLRAGGVNVSYIAKYNGTSWSGVGGGFDNVVYKLLAADIGAGPQLFAGGLFTSAGGTAMKRIARYSGTTWSQIGVGFNNFVNALAAFDPDGSGSQPTKLYAGGAFTYSGGTVCSRIARWDGTGWAALRSGVYEGLNGQVYDLAVFDPDGTGPTLPSLYVGGYFTTAGSVTVNYIARWLPSGTSGTWYAVGGGMNSAVRKLLVFDDDGSGPHGSALFVGGVFTMAGTTPASRMAQWNGNAWSALNEGVDGMVNEMAGFDNDGSGELPTALFVGGDFTAAGGETISRFARWGCAPPGAAPIIQIQPVDTGAYLNGQATFSVKAVGDPPLSYQWRHNGQNIPNSNSENLTISPVLEASAGTYDVVVTNPGGSTTSDPATLTIVTLMRGDTNCDLQIGFLDIDFFVAAVPNNQAAWQTLYIQRYGVAPICPFANCDVDGNGNVGFEDIDPFVALIGK